MALYLDVLTCIGDHCDPKTRYNLCLADKAYYKTQTKFLETQRVTKIKDNVLNMMNSLEYHTPTTRLKIIHKIYRYVLKHGNEVLKGYPKVVDIMYNKLEEFETPTTYNSVHMSSRMALKYRKELSVYF